MAPFRRVDERRTYEGPFLTVVRASIEAPGGETFQREYLRHHGAVAVVPLVADDTVLLVRQYRAAVDCEMLEIPAGLLDVEGEEPEAAARRELEEEIGRRAIGALEPLVDYVPSAGMADHRVTIYLSRRSEQCEARPDGVEEGQMTLHEVRLADVHAMVVDGRITDGKTIVGLLLARDRLR